MRYFALYRVHLQSEVRLYGEMDQAILVAYDKVKII